MQRNNTPVLLIAIVLGVLALGATAIRFLRPQAAAPTAPAEAVMPTPVPKMRWVAARYIPPRTVINTTMLRQEPQPGDTPANAIKSVDDVQGQLTSEPINAGETVLLSSFTPRIQRQIEANIPIPPGLRGVAIWVNPAQTAAGLVDVGDRVDVIATNKLSFDKGPRQYVIGAQSFSTGRTIAQNLLVLGAESSIKAPTATPTPVPGAPAGAPPPPTPVPVAAGPASNIRILLAATPDVAARLVAANEQGTLNITIRNPMDGDAGVVPEAREYPSRLYTAAKESTGGSSGGGNARPARSMPNMGPMPALPAVGPLPRANTALPAPVPMPIGTPGVNELANAKEITVIRGTEKTRVIVPQR